jgi:hypothetical protein
MVREFSGKNINVAVLASHCKICLIESEQGNVIIAGSANLSSSNNVEQFQIMHDDKVFQSVKKMLDSIIKKYTDDIREQRRQHGQKSISDSKGECRGCRAIMEATGIIAAAKREAAHMGQPKADAMDIHEPPAKNTLSTAR